MRTASVQTIIWETLKKMIHTILSNGREETNITFNYLKCSVMTHIGLGHFQNRLLFSSNTLVLITEENKLLAIQDNKQDQSAFNRTIQILKKGGGFPPKCPPPQQNTKSKKLSGLYLSRPRSESPPIPN